MSQLHYTKTNWLNNEAPAISESNLGKIEDALETAYEELNERVQTVNGEEPDSQGNVELQLLPTGGTAGQVLIKDSAEYADASWGDIYDLPSGGEAGQVLVKTASDEGASEWQTKEVVLTQAEYDALPNSKLSDGVSYFITDGVSSPSQNQVPASGVTYDNTFSGLSATNIQDAINELKALIDAL